MNDSILVKRKRPAESFLYVLIYLSAFISVGVMIEQAIQMAIEGLINQNTELAAKAMEEDDEIDRQEKKIQDMCFRLLLHQQPVAGDLRLVTAALKMISDMERIGDHAVNIAEWVIFSITGSKEC